MKEFQDIQKINIRLAQKFEKMGYFKEADKIDNINLMLSQRITIAGGPTNNFGTKKNTGPTTPTTPTAPTTPTTPIKNVNVTQFLQGVQAGIKTISGKSVNLVKLIPVSNLDKFNTLFGRAIGSIAILYEAYVFFTQYNDDMSGKYGDSPREIAQIARSLSGVVSGLGMLATTLSGPLLGLATAITSISFVINIILSVYLDYGNPEDEVDVDKKSYPGGALNFVDDALGLAFPNTSKTFEESYSKLTIGELTKLKQKIADLAIKNNYSATSVQQAFEIIDKKTGAGTFSPRDIAKQYKIKPAILPRKQKPINKDMQGFDVPFTP